MIWLAVRQFLGANWLIVGLASAAIVSVVGWDSSRKAEWVQSGKESARVEQKAATDAANNRGSAAADKSGRVRPSRGAPLTYRD